MTEIREEVSKYSPYYVETYHTGSREICDPPPKDTDDDYILLCFEGGINALEDKLLDDGYELGGSFDAEWREDTFKSYKLHKDDDTINLILTLDPVFYENFTKATKLSKALNLLKKEDRVTVFQAVVSDSWPVQYRPSVGNLIWDFKAVVEFKGIDIAPQRFVDIQVRDPVDIADIRVMNVDPRPDAQPEVQV